jgi:hypothetical protein
MSLMEASWERSCGAFVALRPLLSDLSHLH